MRCEVFQILAVLVISAVFTSTSFTESREQAGGHDLPLSALPDGVVAPPGKLTLFADYGNLSKEALSPEPSAETGSHRRITLYIVNRTGKPVNLPAQDGDLSPLSKTRN